MTGGEIYAACAIGAASVCIVGGAIMFLDWIASGVRDALDIDFSDADSRTAALRNSLTDEERGDPSQTGRGDGAGKGPGLQDTNAVQITSSVRTSERRCN